MFERDITVKKVESDVSHQKVQIVSFFLILFSPQMKVVIKRPTALSKGVRKRGQDEKENSCLHLSIKL